MRKKYLAQFSLVLLLLSSNAIYSCPLSPAEIESGGQCVDIDGYQLYIHSSGKDKPNIIFEAGLGDSTPMWDKVTPQVEKFAHVITYDRNGLGKSQTKPGETQPRTAQQAVDKLRLLLKKTQTNPPYILVGHSLGGLYMQLFAQEYPSEVSAVILVDSATKEQKEFPPLPPKDANYYLEADGMKESINQVKNAPSFPNIPLVILSTLQRGNWWNRLQKNLLTLSNQSKQKTTKNSGHYIQREEPELVINALEEIVKKN